MTRQRHVPGSFDREFWSGPIPGTHEPGFVEALPIKIGDTHGAPEYRVTLWRMGDCQIIRAYEPLGPDGAFRWHLSISCVDRHPSWDEIKTARYRLLPHDRDFALLLPPPHEYINVAEQDHVFHLHETG